LEPVPVPQPSGDLTKAELERRLRPAGYFERGLLGAYESLDEVLARDAETLTRLGVSYDDLADRLGELMKKALEMWRRPVPPEQFEEVLARRTDFPNLNRPETIPHFDLHNLPDIHLGFLIGHLQVFLVNYKGWQYCPWGCNATTSSDFMIVNRVTGQSVTAPELMPHLIRTHHFFGGLRSPYRTNPEQLARVLELVTG
jgi:hypothetical protein